jgi:hypothetical protein
MHLSKEVKEFVLSKQVLRSGTRSVQMWKKQIRHNQKQIHSQTFDRAQGSC